MKYLFLLLLAITLAGKAGAQKIEKRVETKAKQKVDTKVDQSIDKGLDKVDNAINNIFKKKEKKKSDGEGAPTTTAEDGGDVAVTTRGSSDFTPGASVIFEDNFAADALNDFPARWNTNGSGKVVTISKVPGKWLSIVHNSTVNPVMDKSLPENSTIEFDLFLMSRDGVSVPAIQFGITTVRDILKEDIGYNDKFYTAIQRYNERDGKTVEYGLKELIGNKNDFPLTSYVNKVLHVSMAINKTRIRVYLDKAKLIDLPRALTDKMRNNFYLQNMYIIPASEQDVLISNIRIASASTDARSLLIKQLLEEGRAVTNDILFDVNSDVIKPQSYDIIRQFGDALVKEPSLKIKITGHTDGDGGGAANLVLSQKRAAAVKTYITENFAVVGSRIQTDGKGASQPVAGNTNAEGKAKNRRVEFEKL